jgi:hypothetical protein
MTERLRAQPSLTPMHRGRLPASSCRHARVVGLQRPSGRNASPSGITPSTIMSPTRRTAGSRSEIRLGARAHHSHTVKRANAPPGPDSNNQHQALDAGPAAQIRTEGVAQSRFGNAAACSRKCTPGPPSATTSGRTARLRWTRWPFSEPTLRTDPVSSPGVCATASTTSGSLAHPTSLPLRTGRGESHQ